MYDRRRYFRQEKAYSSQQGFTLIEVLVSMAIFSILALTLAVFMNATVESYTINTSRRNAYSTATAILNQLELDLVQAYLAPGDRNSDIDVLFYAERDSIGNTKMSFVAMSSNPEATSDRGLQEIGWYINSGEGFPYSICRISRNRIGGNDSIIENLTVPEGVLPEFGKSVGYFSVRFIPDTSSLSDEGLTLDDSVMSYGYPIWDSTRGKNPDFPLNIQDSADNPWDDILPMRVVITLTILPEHGMIATLTEPLDANATTVKVDTTNDFPAPSNDVESFIFIENEWMFFDKVDDESFSIFERGSRGTTATPHEIGKQVRAGYSFIRTIVIPCGGKAIR